MNKHILKSLSNLNIGLYILIIGVICSCSRIPGVETGHDRYDTPPKVYTETYVTASSSTSVKLYGKVTNVNDLSYENQIYERGFMYGLNEYSLSKIKAYANSDGSFEANVYYLSPATRYYYRAYAVCASGTYYGEMEQFYTRNGSQLYTGNVSIQTPPKK